MRNPLFDQAGLYCAPNPDGLRGRMSKPALLICAALAPWALAAPPTTAQTRPSGEETTTLGEVIVTADKREQPLRDLPQAVTVLDPSGFVAGGVTSLDDLVDRIPGASVTTDFGATASKSISLRGVGGVDDYRPNGSGSVAMHVDGVYQASNLFFVLPLFDLSRVEVLKGPQGTLYGRNSTAGVVNIVTARNTAALNGFVRVDADEYDRTRIEAAVGGPISEGMGLRVALLSDQGGGFQSGRGAGPLAGRIFQTAAGPLPDPGVRDGWGDRDLLAARLTLAIEPGPAASLTIRAFATRDQGESLQQDTLGGVVNGAFSEPDDDPRTFYGGRYPVRDIEMAGLEADLKATLSPDVDLTVIAGLQTGSRYFEGEGTGSPQRSLDFDFNDEVDQATIEARLSDGVEGRFDWLVGVYYLDDQVDFATTLLAYDLYRSNILTDYRQERTSSAVFGQVDYDLAPALTLSGGLRYTTEEARFVGATTDLNPLGASIVAASIRGLPVVFDNDFDEDDVSGRLTLSYRPRPEIMVYGSVGKGYKAGGFDGSSIFSEPEALPFRPETLWAYEAGLKATGPRGLFVSADAFYYDFDDLQANTTTLIDGRPTPANVRTNVAKARLYGIDLALGVDLLDSGPHDLGLRLDATFLDSEVLEFSSSNPAIVEINVGNDLPAAPRASANAALRYAYQAAQGWIAGFDLVARYKDAEFKRLDNTPATRVPAYTVLDFTGRFRLPNSSVEISAYVRNLTDELYFLNRGATSRLAGPPRTAGVAVRYSF